MLRRTSAAWCAWRACRGPLCQGAAGAAAAPFVSEEMTTSCAALYRMTVTGALCTWAMRQMPSDNGCPAYRLLDGMLAWGPSGSEQHCDTGIAAGDKHGAWLSAARNPGSRARCASAAGRQRCWPPAHRHAADGLVAAGPRVVDVDDGRVALRYGQPRARLASLCRTACAWVVIQLLLPCVTARCSKLHGAAVSRR